MLGAPGRRSGSDASLLLGSDDGRELEPCLASHSSKKRKKRAQTVQRRHGGSAVRVSMAAKVFGVVFATALLVGLTAVWYSYQSGYFVDELPSVMVDHDVPSVELSAWPRQCSTRQCFQLAKCKATQRLRVFVYPDTKFVNKDGDAVMATSSIEYNHMMTAVRSSRYYESDPEKACLFLPAVDMLNLYRVNPRNLTQALTSLKWYGDGSNHLLVSMLYNMAQVASLRVGKAMIAGAGFSPDGYRSDFDVSIPFFNPKTAKAPLPAHGRLRQFVLIVPLISLSQLEDLYPKLPITRDILVFERCKLNSNITGAHSRHDDERKRCSKSSLHSYPAVLVRGDFCLLRPVPVEPALLDAAKTGCIPVIIKNSRVMPYAEGIDWSAASIEIYPDQIPQLPDILRKISVAKKEEMRNQVRTLFDRFFQSPGKVLMAALQAIEDRLSPNKINQHHYWNKLETAKPEAGALLGGSQQTQPLLKTGDPHTLPLFMLHPSRQSRYFTAVILSYDRFKTLIRVLKKIDSTPSLIKVIVVWNNLKVKPPPQSSWPKLNTTLQVLQSKYNRLNNRFIPFKEIETDCILSLDDDIEMVTPGELEFGFQVWKEFPDRLVGFPGRLHFYNHTVRRYQYTSSWGSELSMVLTGAAFHHKYYSYLYTYVMPKAIRHWINRNMNCEDIAMNYLITGFTGKPPIKATPKKRFRCERCSVNESLWDGPGYFAERNLCLNNFTRLYGNRMPLRHVSYRADPVLYTENVPIQYQRFGTVGNL